MLQIPELLAPAGDAERLRYAINYGADAVYCGLPEFGMRSAPANFTPEQLTESVIYAHARGRKVYLTMNTLPTNEEADRLPEAIKEAAKAGVDAFIVADLGVLDACKTFAPDIDVHLSTQTGITNWAAARAAYKMGAKRVVLAREMTLQDIAILRDKTPPELEIEAFVHGAMCMSVSGRCLLSNYMAGRDANRGQCAQPCRWKYYLSEETRPGQLYEIGENENGSYILNANDLCTAPFIDLICKAGVDSLKIEGRAKTFYYVASVTAAYRKALDAYLADPANDNFELPPEVYAELTRTSHRHYSPGFYFGREQAKQATDSATYIREWEFVGTVDSWENGIAHCQQRGKWSLGDTLEALCPDGRSIPLTPEWIENEAGERVERFCPLRPSGRAARTGFSQHDALSRLLGSGQSVRHSGKLVLWPARASVAAEHLLGVHSAVRLLCATGASYHAPWRTGVRGRGACHGGHTAFYAGGQSCLWCADPAGQRYAADRPFGKATAAHSTRSRVCYLRSAVRPDPQCFGRLFGFWKPAPLAAADTVCKLRYSVLWLLSVVVLFYGLFCPSAVAVSVLGGVLSLRRCRAAAHGALAPLGLPAAGLAWAALAAAVSAAPAGHLRGAAGGFPRIRWLKHTLHALLSKAALLHRANIALMP